VGLAHDLGTGTLDFFAEPAKGLMISPEAFGSGLAKGSGSLIKGTLGGLLGAASSITNSASKAMATASGDDQFAASQAASRGHAPEHAVDGLRMGVTALGTSLYSGVTGVFLDPLAGARKDGVMGFGKGLAKGVAGLVFKPIAGVLDLTSNTLKGIGQWAHDETGGICLDGHDRSQVFLLLRVCVVQATRPAICSTVRWRSCALCAPSGTSAPVASSSPTITRSSSPPMAAAARRRPSSSPHQQLLQRLPAPLLRSKLDADVLTLRNSFENSSR